MPDTRGIPVAISNRRPVLTDDPEYDRLLLEAHAEDPSQLQPDERAYAETLLAGPATATVRSQNDPAADRARLGMPENAPYASTMGQVLNMGGGPTRDPRSEAERLQAVEAVRTRLASQSRVQQLNDSLDLQAGPRMGAAPPLARSTARISAAPASMWTVAGDSLMAPVSGVIRGLKTANVLDDTPTPIADQAALDERRFHPKSLLGGDTSRIGPPKESRSKEALRAGYWNMRGVGAGEEEPETTGTVLGDMLSDPTNWLEFGKAPVAMAAAMIGKPKKLVAAVRTAKRLKEAVEPFIGALDKASHKALIQEVKAAFPHLDSYSTLSPHLTAASITKKLDTLSPDAQAAVRAIAAVMPPGERIAPKQLQALVARKTYTPDRIVVRHNTTLAQHQARGKEYLGAPWHVHTPRLQASSDQQYLEQVLDGLEGADWYDDSGKEVMFRTGDNPVRARQTSDGVAITSPQTDVNVNTAFAVQGSNQRAMGRPIRTGRYPAVMGPKIEAAYAAEGAETLGPKRGPFADNIAIGGDFFDADRPIRGVHDIWDGEARGFANPDGTPLRRGFTAPEHRWMDAQDARLIAFANDTKLGGRTDWTVGRLQAAAWTGSKKRAGDILPGQPVANIATAFGRPNIQAQGSREVASPIHFTELNEPQNRPELNRYSRLVREESGVYDSKGRDRLALEMDALVGKTSEGPGMFKNDPALGYQTDVSATTQPTVGPSLAGINLESLKLPQKQYDKLAKLIAEGKTLDQALSGKFGREMEISAQELLTVTESAYALVFGQAAGAGSMMGKMPTEAALRAWRVAATSIYDVPMLGAEVLLGATPTDAQMQTAMQIFTRAGATPDSIAPVFVPGRGIRFGNLADSTLSNDQFKKAVNDVAKTLGGSKTQGRFSSIYVPNNWDTQPYGQGYLGNLLPHAETLDPLLKEISSTMLTDVDPYMKKTTSGKLTASRRLTRIREVLSSGEGLQALEALAKKNGLPLLGLLALLGVAPPSSMDETGADISGSRDNAVEGANPAYAGSMRSLLAR